MSARSLVEIVEPPAETPGRQIESAPARAPRSAPCPVVYVLFTSFAETLCALRVASDLARSLDGTVRLVDFRVVQVGAPVDWPAGRSPLQTTGLLDRLCAEGIHVRPHVYVCRDAHRAARRVLPRHSLVVIGARRRPWRTRADRWRRVLERQGHLVVMVDQTVLT